LFLSLVFRIINKDIHLTYPNKCTLEEIKLNSKGRTYTN